MDRLIVTGDFKDATLGIRRRGLELGYSLVALAIAITVMNVLVAAALPVWSTLAQRQKEKELIFRGLQYAEAIRVFQQRFGRFPVTLEELIKVEPRSIRQLWPEPMSADGKWDLVIVRPNRRRRIGRNHGNQGAPTDVGRELAGGSAPQDRFKRGDAAQQRSVGPISGVRSKSQETALKTFLGSQQYSGWVFTADLIKFPTVAPGSSLPALPRLTSDWIGRPFRQGLQPPSGSSPQKNTP